MADVDSYAKVGPDRWVAAGERRYVDALADYHRHFPLPHKIIGGYTYEATPIYLFRPQVAQRLFDEIQDIQYGKAEDPMGWITPVC